MRLRQFGGLLVCFVVLGSHTLHADCFQLFPDAARGVDGDLIRSADGNLWATGEKELDRITTDGIVSRFGVPYNPSRLAATADAVWFTTFGAVIGRLSPTSGAVTTVSIPSETTPDDICATSVGEVWFTERSPNLIGRISPSGAISEYPASTDAGNPSWMTRDASGQCWYFHLSAAGSFIVKASPDLNRDSHQIRFASAIAASPDGTFWFSEGCLPPCHFLLSHLEPGGTITSYEVPGWVPSSITFDADARPWASAFYGYLATVSNDGRLLSYTIPTSDGGYAGTPIGATAFGSDGNLWFLSLFGFGRFFPTRGPRSITSVVPIEGSISGGSQVTIFGTGFQNGDRVLFGNAFASDVNVISDTQISALTPNHAVGTVTVAIQTCYESTIAGVLPHAFAYYQPPRRRAISH